MNIEEGDSKKQLSQVEELSFGQFQVFSCFGKTYSKWFDGRDTKSLMIDWLTKEKVLELIPMQV
jgi:hypothetical protein